MKAGALPHSLALAIGKNDSQIVRACALDLASACDQFSIEPVIEQSEQLWSQYIRGVVAGIQKITQLPSGFDIVISGNVPQGASLSSSASLELAIIIAISHLFNLNLTRTQMAEIGQSAEHHYAGCQCGIMDQMVIACAQQGKVLLLDCVNYATEQVTLPDSHQLLIVNSNVQRGLVDSEYNTSNSLRRK